MKAFFKLFSVLLLLLTAAPPPAQAQIPQGYGIARGWPLAGGQISVNIPASANLRTVPSDGNTFYIVSRNADATGDVLRFQRNVGGAASASNVGVSWPEWRYTGRWRTASFTGPVSVQSLLYFDDAGAQDIVAANASLKYFSSFHGLGPNGSLNSESLFIDDRPFNPAVANYGNSLTLRNSTTASDGTTVFTRDLTTVVDSVGTVNFTVNSVDGANVLYYYVGMLTGTGGFNEFDIRFTEGGPWVAAPPAGLGANNAYITPSANIKGVRSRNTTTGAAVVITGGLAANVVRTETERTGVVDRQKVYYSRYSDATSILGLQWQERAEQVTTGSMFAGTNLLVNGNFASGDLTGWTVTTGATPVATTNQLVQTRAAAQQRLRQTTALAGNRVAAFQSTLSNLSGGAAPILKMTTDTALSNANAFVSSGFSTTGINTWITGTPLLYYVGTEFGAGTVGQTATTDDYGIFNLGQ